MNHALWYATRATGVVALITALLHKNIALLVTAFIGIHVATTLLDSFVKINPVAAIIPFASSYRPFWLGLGTIACDLILALIATSLLRSRLSYRVWRAVHIMAYASWPIALWHGLGTGTDARLPWLMALDGLCMLAVASALAWRARLMPPGAWRAAALTAAAAVRHSGGATEQVKLSLVINGHSASGRILLNPGRSAGGGTASD